MTAGRCAGCGFTDPSCKKVTAHMLDCDDLATLYSESPEKVLSAEDEYARWQQETGTPDAREAERDERRRANAEAKDVRRHAMATRYNPKDILDDE